MVHLQPGGVLLVDPLSQFYLRLTQEGAELALLLARTNDLDRTAVTRSCVTGERVEDVRSRLARMLEAQPTTTGWASGFLGDQLHVTGSAVAYLPLHCSLQLTNACNLSCSFCYASSGARYPRELSTDAWLGVMAELAANGVMGVTLTGGEPTLLRDFRQILAAAAAYFSSVDVFTNGMSWADADVALAASVGNVRCQVSVDGLAERHDRIRGHVGSFRRALTTIHRLDRAGLPVVVTMTATPENYQDVGAVIDEVAAAGATLFRAGMVRPVGRGAEGSFALDPSQRDDVSSQLLRASRRHDRLVVTEWGGCGVPGEPANPGELPLDFCTPGYLSWHIRADGVVTPCQVEERALGHVLDDLLVTIGNPERLARLRTEARACRCMGQVQLSAQVGLPFSEAPASACAGC